MPAEILKAVTTVVALIAFGLLCGAYLCPLHFDDTYREWTVRRRRRTEEKRSRQASPAETPDASQRG